MGVAGLWDLIQHTSETRSLTHLAVVDGFQKNVSGLRGYRIGIDASIWFFHAQSGREGENPELRLIFFRLAKLLSEPFLPLFVFDGPKRPSWKRGIQISKKPHWMIHGVKTMISAFGFEWRQAPGEAEAELAYLNRVGVIDGILSDDVDNFLFGALTVIRNPGRGLTGNLKNPALNAEGKDDGNHVRIFRAAKIASDETVGINRAGFILIGLLSGGDYEEKHVPGSKLNGCGMATAHALARCGFGEELVNAFSVLPDDTFAEYLNQWRDALRSELRTNSRGYLPRKQAKLAASVSNAFPCLKVLHAYVQPVTTESQALLAGLSSPPVPQIQWRHEHSLATLARFCEEKFEWGTMQIIPKRFRSLLWHGSVMRILRRAMLDIDRGEGTSWKNGHPGFMERPSTTGSTACAIPTTPTKNSREAAIGTPSRMITKYFADITLHSPAKQREASSDQDVATADSDEEHPLISNISASTTAHPQTDFLLEYRIELDPYQLVLLTQSGIEGVREEPADASDANAEDEEVDGPRNQKPKPKAVDPFSLHRIWVPACMLQPVEKELVDAYEAKQGAKEAKKTRKAPPKGKRTATGPDPVTDTASISTAKSRPKFRKGASASAGVRAKKATSAAPSNDDDEENFDLDAVSDTSDSDASGGPKTAKPTTTTASRKATARGKKVQREIATDSETDADAGGEQAPFDARPRQKSIKPLSLLSKPIHAKTTRLPRGGPSAQGGPPAQDKSKTSQSSVLKALDATDWDDLFPPAASKAPAPSSLSPSSPTHKHQSQRGSKAGSTAAPLSPSKRRRRQVPSDTGEISERTESSRGAVPKSPRKSKSQVSPSHQKEKTAISRTNRQENLVLPDLSSSSDSEDDDVLSGRRRVVSPTPRKGAAANDPFHALWDKVGHASRQGSKRSEEIIDVSSEDGDAGVAPMQRMSPNAADDLARTITRKEEASTVSKSTQQPRLPFRPVKTKATAAAKKTIATKTHFAEDSISTPHAQRNTLAADVIDLTTP